MMIPFFRNPINYLALLAYSMIFAIGYEKKERYWLRLIAAAIPFTVAVSFMWAIYPIDFTGFIRDAFFILFIILRVLACFITVQILYNEKPATVLFITSSAYIALDFGSNISTILEYLPGIGEMVTGFPASLITLIIVKTLVGGAIYFLIGRNLKKHAVNTDDRVNYVFSTATIFLLLVIARLSDHIPATLVSTLAFGLHRMVCCVLLLFLRFYVMTEEKNRSQIRNLSHIISTEEKQRDQNQEAEDALRIFAHDLKNRSLLYKISDTEPEKTAEEFDNRINSGNRVFDIVVEEKNRLCKEKGISLSVIADGKLLAFIDPSDLCALLGNALDNAIEGCCTTNEKCISLSVKERGGMISIHIENSKPDGTVSLRSSDMLPDTTKAEKHGHGYGMMSMRNIVEKYEGVFSFKVECNRFILNMLFTSG